MHQQELIEAMEVQRNHHHYDSRNVNVRKGGSSVAKKKESKDVAEAKVIIDKINLSGMTKNEKKAYIKDNKEAVIREYSKVRRRNKKLPVLTKEQKKELGIGLDEARATLTHARISSRKAKAVIDVIKNKDIAEAYGILKNTRRKAATFLLKLLKSAESNATFREKGQLEADKLYVADAYANQGPTLKRIMPRAQGRANRIRKRTSHITVVVKERN